MPRVRGEFLFACMIATNVSEDVLVFPLVRFFLVHKTEAAGRAFNAKRPAHIHPMYERPFQPRAGGNIEGVASRRSWTRRRLCTSAEAALGTMTAELAYQKPKTRRLSFLYPITEHPCVDVHDRGDALDVMGQFHNALTLHGKQRNILLRRGTPGAPPRHARLVDDDPLAKSRPSGSVSAVDPRRKAPDPAHALVREDNPAPARRHKGSSRACWRATSRRATTPCSPTRTWRAPAPAGATISTWTWAATRSPATRRGPAAPRPAPRRRRARGRRRPDAVRTGGPEPRGGAADGDAGRRHRSSWRPPRGSAARGTQKSSVPGDTPPPAISTAPWSRRQRRLARRPRAPGPAPLDAAFATHARFGAVAGGPSPRRRRPRGRRRRRPARRRRRR